MNVALYRQRRQEAEALQPIYRQRCLNCRQPDFSCFCAWIKPLDPKIEFIILTHPIEYKRRRIVTGRMSYLSLKNSRLIVGHNFTQNTELNDLINDPQRQSVMLYPGPTSKNLSMMNKTERFDWIETDKRLAIVVIDGTWATARKMVHLSQNLKPLPRVCFTPPGPSNFRVRQQPRVDCYSTIEAIHHTLDLLGDACGFNIQAREHDSLLDTFDKMVNRQIELAHSLRA